MKQPYLRWHPALADNISMRGEGLESLNARTMEVIQSEAIDEDFARFWLKAAAESLMDDVEHSFGF
jgi:hypothetical protein